MKMNPSSKQAYKLVHEGLLALSRASQYGMCVDVEYCNKINKTLEKRIQVLKQDFYKSKTGGLWEDTFPSPNLNSDPQLRTILFEELGLKSIKETDKGNPSVDNEVLEFMSDEYPEIKILAYLRKYQKVQGTYIQGYLKEQIDGIIHTDFPLHTTISFRSSSKNPNFQNNPKRDPRQKKLCRQAFIPRPGNQILAADFSGIEVVIAACYHNDPVMQKYILDDTSDMHGDMAVQIFMLPEFKKTGSEKILRNGAKNGFVFPQFYGDYYGNNAPILCKWAKLPIQGRFKESDGLVLMSGETLGKRLISCDIKSFKHFEKHVQKVEKDFWYNRFKVYQKWKEQWFKDYINRGYMWTKTGFTCSGVLGKNQIINLPVQGSAFHCLLKSFVEVDRRLTHYKMKTRLTGQIHDEMLLNLVPVEKDNVIEIIQDVTCKWLLDEWDWINVPLKVEADIFPVDSSWANNPEGIKLAA